jgi:hypothetical protein
MPHRRLCRWRNCLPSPPGRFQAGAGQIRKHLKFGCAGNLLIMHRDTYNRSRRRICSTSGASVCSAERQRRVSAPSAGIIGGTPFEAVEQHRQAARARRAPCWSTVRCRRPGGRCVTPRRWSRIRVRISRSYLNEEVASRVVACHRGVRLGAGPTSSRRTACAAEEGDPGPGRVQRLRGCHINGRQSWPRKPPWKPSSQSYPKSIMKEDALEASAEGSISRQGRCRSSTMRASA